MAKQNLKNTISDSVSWYAETRPTYEQLSKKVQSIISEIIIDEKIPIHAIYSRAKEIDSFTKKIEDPKYTDPKSQITDFSGIRIIAYVESDLEKISTVIKSFFEVDEKNSVDKSQSLGTDKVGYRSIHYIAKLPKDRINLPEYKKFKDLVFEIQIRTILQHSWAEIEHDKNYKFSGELPFYLKRRFKVLAGVLELADREFNSIALEIDQYSASVNADTKKGNLEISIDSTSIKSYLNIKFKDLIIGGLTPNFITEKHEKNVLDELRDFDINTLKDLDLIVPKNFSKDCLNNTVNYRIRSFSGLIRTIMMIKNAEKYFETCWKGNWVVIDKSNVDYIRKYNSKIESIISKHNISIVNDYKTPNYKYAVR